MEIDGGVCGSDEKAWDQNVRYELLNFVAIKLGDIFKKWNRFWIEIDGEDMKKKHPSVSPGIIYIFFVNILLDDNRTN